MARKLAPSGLFTSGSVSSLADTTRGGGGAGGRGETAADRPEGGSAHGSLSSDFNDYDFDDGRSMPSVPGSESRRRTYGGYTWAGHGPGPSSVRVRT